jgi:hypothetical protein
MMDIHEDKEFKKYCDSKKMHVRSVHGIVSCDAWKASRAAIVIELPETPNKQVEYELLDEWKERCAEAIKAAGLRVK